MAAGYHVPAFRAGLVGRPALVQRLISARENELALIVAPAGYGKTTLLTEWAANDERPFIWIKTGPSRLSRSAIVSSIVAAFEDRGWLDTAGSSASAYHRNDAEGWTVPRVMSALTRAEQDFVLVFDDAHLARPATLKSLVAELIENLPAGSQLALASRTEPQLPMGRLRAYRSLVELREEDLTMSPAEAATLLRMAGAELGFAEVQTLLRKTEGWPVGLYLAALALREADVTADGVEDFDGDNHLVTEYFRDEFLAELPAEYGTFLSEASVLDELSGPVCDAMLQRGGSGEILDRLARHHPMLLPVDQRHERFRWHRMFKTALRSELRRSEPEREKHLHARASVWLHGNGDLDGAISHAVAAANIRLTGDLLWDNIAEYLESGRGPQVQAWLARFSSEQITGYPPLALASAYSCLARGQLAQARRWGMLAAISHPRGLSNGARTSFEAGVAIIEATTATAQARQMERAATRAYELGPEHSPWRGLCCLLRGVAEHLIGDRQGAQLALEEGLRLGAGTAPSAATLCLAQLVTLAIEKDDWDRAAELTDSAAMISERHEWLISYPVSALPFAVAAAVRAHQGRLDEAKRDLRRGAMLLAELGDFMPWYGAETRIMLARAALGLADTVRARTLLAEASRLARKTADAIIFPQWLDQAWAEIDAHAEASLSGPSSLTIAELRILRFMPSHRSFREIAERLGVSVNTVKTQAHAIYRKLDVGSRSEAVSRASSAGLL